MRTATTNFTNGLQRQVTSLCRLLEVTRPDATVLYFTDADQDVSWNGHTWQSALSFESSAIFTSATFGSSQNVTLYIAMGTGGFNETDIRAKRYKRAVARILILDRENPSWGAVALFKGVFGRIELTDKNRLTVEVLPRSKGGLEIVGGEAYSATCRNSLFDTRCSHSGGPVKAGFTTSFTVTSAVKNVITAAAFTQADNYWALGEIKWLTGPNAGTTNVVASSDQSDTTVTMVESPLVPVAAGNTGEVYPGCSKQLSMCRDRYNNVANFRGEPYVPQFWVYNKPAITNVAWNHD